MRAGFAQMMATQPQLRAELAELRSNAMATPQLYTEIANLKSALQAAKTGAPTAPPVPPPAQIAARTTPRIKDVICRKFSGQEVYPGLGAGFEDFTLEYEQAISTETLLNQSRWTSQIKASVLVNFLEGKAARFFHSNVTQWRIEKPDFNYDDFKSKLKAEFGCRLNQVQLFQLCKRLTASKRPQDSWSEYLDYLKYVARLMTGNHSLLLLETFCANACPELASTLIAQIDRSHGNYLLEADRMLALLVDLRGDGRKRGQIGRPSTGSEPPDKRRNNTQPQNGQPRGGSNQNRHIPRNGHGQAHAAGKTVTKIVCYVCDEEGHRGPACPKLKMAKAAVKHQGQAHNAVTETTTIAPTAGESEEEGHLVANSDTIVSYLKGSCLLQTTVDGTKQSIILTNVYYYHSSNYNQVFLMHTKDEAFDKFLLFANDFQRQYDLKIKVLRTDGGGEFLNKQFNEYAARNGIRLQNTHPDTSASNGKAERFHRTLMNSARAMLWASSLPQRYWGDAVLYASYIRNRVTTRANADFKSPLAVLTGKQPRVSHILKFGSKCTVFLPCKTGRSLRKRAEKAIVLGISTTQKGYRLLIPRTKRFITSPDLQNIDKMDVQDPCTAEVLHELHGENATSNPVSVGTSNQVAQPVQMPTITDPSEEEVETGVPEDFGRPIPAGVLRRVFGKRKPTVPAEFKLPRSFIDAFVGPAHAMMIIKAADHEREPQSVAEAKRSRHWAEWKAAMDKELAELDANGTWELVQAPDGANIVTIVVLKISSLRFIIMLAAVWRVKLRQGDVPNAYLKSALDKPIYLKPPAGTTSANDRRVWLLLKGLYGLKQSGKLWNDLIDSFLQAQGFQRSQMDPCLYYLRYHDKLCVLGLYVDDILLVSQDSALSDHIMSKLTERFHIKDLGDARKCLGIWIDYTTDGITIHQEQTTLDLLAKMGMQECKTAPTPMEVNHHFFGEHGDPFHDTTLYREAIGSLLWISNCTRPDIATATNCLSRFVSCPTSVHWKGVKRILRYLKGTTNSGLFYKFGHGIASKLQTIIYSDANWAGDSSSAKSTSGSVLQINGMTISWSSRKQTTVALSTMEAEYVAACSAVQDCIAIHQLLQELGLMQQTDAVLLRVDNQSAIKSMRNVISTQRTRHLQIKYHFIRDAIANKKIQVEYCPSQQQLADVFTKATERIIFGRLCSMLRLTSHA
ncbi:Integrase catalytic core protein [Phytophthora palmivora]|uniref:Integrase catalytic core protein n=1 Tax=Phytophthora palmivora TaxID=4796 RepID=A0A2P4YFB2_9STRA|nr:Integrase catalytic core protein [Phytophthora palmivora]